MQPVGRMPGHGLPAGSGSSNGAACTPLMQRSWGDDWVDLAERFTYR